MDQILSEKKVDRSTAFVDYCLGRINKDTGFGAALRRADNPSTEYMSWEHLSKWCDLDNQQERLCFATVAAAVARSKKSDSHFGSFGKSIEKMYDEGSSSDAAKAKLRRLLACSNSIEACKWVRPSIRLAQSRNAPINFPLLLNDLLWFGQIVKERWACDFYGRRGENSDSVNA